MLEGNNYNKLWKDKDKDNKWLMLKEGPNKGRNFKKYNNKKCKLLSEELCSKNSLNKTAFNKWTNKREELNNNNIKEKYRECGKKDFKLIVCKKRENKKNIEELCKIKIGNKK